MTDVQTEISGGESPEALLTRLSSKEIFKASKDVAKVGVRLCGTHNADGTVSAMYRHPKSGEILTVTARTTQKSAHCTCSACGEKTRTLCPHAFSALVYDLKHTPARPADIEQSEIKYQGLQNFDYAMLADKASGNPEGWLRVDVENDFPHVPSKWEKAVFLVTMTVAGRVYKGNIANIRQLHFDKGPSTLKGSDFSLQERQILRYLAVNAEAENTKLMLDSEQTAEFLHCLIGFPRFYQSGQRIVIHGEPAAPVLMALPDSEGRKIQSAISFNGTLLPLENARVVTGRNGVWAGFRGEYWWVPGIWDVAWLRSFFRNPPQKVSEREAKHLMGEISKCGVQISERRQPRLRSRKPDILFDCALPSPEIFHLLLRFVYGETVLTADQARLYNDEKRLLLRDSDTESALIDQLRYFGFTQPTQEPSLFVLPAEAVSTFVTEELPRLLSLFPQIHTSRLLTSLTHPAQLLPRITFKREDNDFLYLETAFYAEGRPEPLYWNEVAETLKQNRRSIRFAEGEYVQISPPLFDFLRAVQPVLLPVKGHDKTLRISRANIPFWVRQGENLPGTVPSELQAVCDKLSALPEIIAPQPTGITAEFKGELRPYQSAGVSWILQRFNNRFNAVLADEMGLGKTVQALCVLAQTPHAPHKPHLIICPTSLTENWRREAARFVPEFRTAVACGPTRSLIWSDPESYDLIIVSYAIARRDIAEIQKHAFTIITLDEAQHIKNPATANAKTCRTLNAAHRLVLTGTPLENAPEDLWSIFDFLHPNMLGSLNAFSLEYGSAQPGETIDFSLLAARLAPFMLRRRKSEVCQELPPRTEQTLYCELTPEQTELYNQYLETGRRQCSELLNTKGAKKQISRFDILATLLRLRQICCNPALLPDVDGAEHLPSAKTELLLELLSENIDSGHKVLLFSQFTSLLAIIRKELDALGIPYEYLDGSTKDRQERVDHFNNSPEIPVFLLSLKAGGTGLNLTGADTVVLYDPWWNPAVENQAADRSHRIGQIRPVTVIRLVAQNTIEERILTLQAKKQSLFDQLVEDPSRDPDLQSLTMKEIASLFNG